MKKVIRTFILRGLMFGGFGPMIVGIVFLILQHTLPDFALTGTQVFMAILSTYLLAFIQAGASVFNQIEHWPIAKSLLFHFLFLYVAYVGCYLINSWIPFEPIVILVFTGVFVVTYFAIWLTVYLIVKATAKRMCQKIQMK
jgi:hypothetical protein